MKKEIESLRKLMVEKGVDVYIVPTGDFHGSEYIHDYFKTREFLTGFTGSAGTLVVTRDKAKLWTDSRYFLQAAAELDGSGIDLMKIGEDNVPTIVDFLGLEFRSSHSFPFNNDSGVTENAPKKDPVLGFDGRVVSLSSAKDYEEVMDRIGGHIRSDLDLVDEIWDARPELSGNPVWELPLPSAGLPYEAKIKQVRDLMNKVGATHHLITTLDDNAWLYNLRGGDVDRTPVFFSYTLITPDSVNLYIWGGSTLNFSDGVGSILESKNGNAAKPAVTVPSGVTIRDYFDISEDLSKIPSDSVLLISPDSTSYSLYNSISEGVEVLEEKYGPVIRLKSIKNPIEIEATKKAHIYDGVAMVNFISWLKSNIGAVPLTEISASDYLERERAMQPGFIDLSFDTISGYGPHGAIVHYSATPETDSELRPEGFLLVDSGGQYINGTTDITRTIALGPLTDKMKKSYTGVLKGHLALAMAKFKDGTNGKVLDEITKAPMKKLGLDYLHGTGHGVGHVLCVHDGPQNISSQRGDTPFLPGMITSDEPGYYPEGEFGIRIENEILCVIDNSGESDYGFEMLTCCPYEREAIVKEMLTEDEIAYIDSYHAWVFDSLKDKVKPEASAWLEAACEPL